MKVYILKTERLGLRNWIDSDSTPFAELNADPEVRRYFPGLMSQEESDKMIERMKVNIQLHGFGFWAVDVLETNEFIGAVGLFYTDLNLDFTPCTEVGWRLKKSAWGKGYASEAANASLMYGFQMLHLDKIYSWTSVHNTPSEKVMQGIGMEKIKEFDHPKIEDGHWLKKHVLYAISRESLSGNQI